MDCLLNPCLCFLSRKLSLKVTLNIDFLMVSQLPPIEWLWIYGYAKSTRVSSGCPNFSDNGKILDLCSMYANLTIAVPHSPPVSSHSKTVIGQYKTHINLVSGISVADWNKYQRIKENNVCVLQWTKRAFTCTYSCEYKTCSNKEKQTGLPQVLAMLVTSIMLLEMYSRCNGLYDSTETFIIILHYFCIIMLHLYEIVYYLSLYYIGITNSMHSMGQASTGEGPSVAQLQCFYVGIPS